ncbi:MAG: radical SAM family heme chaperone HemW [Rickettsiales bacterium]|nr:radical SAM family heme chaperone HemW [Rickettsiales bacterium]
MNSSFYIHWPFCEKKCPYCDFNSHERDNINYQDWENAYLKEIDYYANILNPQLKITTIFFGGGTPSLMKPKTIEKIIDRISQKFNLEKNAEITLEANPSSSEAEKFKNFKLAGVNRISIGVQSFNEENLKFLGRKHNSSQAINAIKMAGKIFDNFSFDLIYALPNQNINNWRQELDFAFEFGSPHLSLYQLTIEKGTDFYGRYKRKEFALPNTDIQNDLYNLTIEKAKKNGLLQYEISNFSRKGFESKHNMNYWQYGDYIGIGAGAHGRLLNGNWKLETGNSASNLKTQTLNIHSPEKWLESIKKNNHGLQSKTKLTFEQQVEEFVYMGLRVKKGFSFKKFNHFAGKNFEDYFDKKIIENLIEAKYLKISNDRVKPTNAGLLLHRGIIHKLFL